MTGPRQRGGDMVYFAEACGKIKIGVSNNPEKRIQFVGEWIPFPITLLATMRGSLDLEGALHAMFDADWSHGEWFNPSERLYDLIAKVQRGEPIGIDTSARSERRRGFIADKKRLTRRLGKLQKHGGELPAELCARINAVPKGVPIPAGLLAEAHRFIDEGIAA